MPAESAGLYADLAWLPQAPAEFRARCRTLAASSEPDLRELKALATHALDESKLRVLARVIDAVRAAGKSLGPLVPFRLGLIGNATLEPIVPALVATALRYGIALECIASEFAQTAQEANSPGSAMNRARPDAVLIALDYRGLPVEAGEALAFVETLRAGFRTHANAISIVQTLAPPAETVFGSYDCRVESSVRGHVSAYNAGLVRSLADTPDVLFDVGALAQTVGLAAWYSPGQWNLAKLAFDATFIPLYADHVCRLLAALRGKSRRCLVLDLDNTIWGGVIGDDGIEGIVIGQGSATGEAYLDVQRYALALRERGIVLAVSSKNRDDAARAAFREHPEMLLREQHIAVFQANWDDKATNLAAIAEELSLGLESLVFVDDNPVERGLVRAALPEVAVPELPEDPALYARTLAAAGYFESIAFSSEDRSRAEAYRGNARRAALREASGDLDAYLASLEMEIAFAPFDAIGRARIAQLVNKSNQFNLTTRRYTESDIAGFENDPQTFALQTRLRDRFGDNGMIGVTICRSRADFEWEIDTWLMSCRVLGRGVERMVLREILHHARLHSIRNVWGRYVPTERNRLVFDHYEKLGFAFVDEDESGVSTWRISADAEVAAAPITVDRGAVERSYAGRPG